MSAFSVRSVGQSIALVLLLASVATAEEFRIRTKIFLGARTSASAENLTLFTDGTVYDFLLTEPKEVTIFDQNSERFVLLDMRRKVKRLLRKHGYPPDKRAEAVVTVIEQAELVARDWARAA